jgi:hypothetical protein
MNGGINKREFSPQIGICDRAKSNGNELIKHSWKQNSATLRSLVLYRISKLIQFLPIIRILDQIWYHKWIQDLIHSL